MNSTFITENMKAKIRINLPPRIVEIIIIALKPELETHLSDRSTISILKTPNGVNVICTASDTTALRAALNSYLRWIKGILDMIEDLQ